MERKNSDYINYIRKTIVEDHLVKFSKYFRRSSNLANIFVDHLVILGTDPLLN